MPGVPTGRGCEACRKQKKKCDQASPACSRCSRLVIECRGAGKQRFKFVEQNPKTPPKTPSGQVTPDQASPPAQDMPIVAKAGPLNIIPSSKTTLIAGNLISKLSTEDSRFDATCFGPFLRFVPSRIGSNDALDTAVDAFCTAFSNLHVETPSVQAIVKHGRALNSLRDCLGDPSKSRASETVCAIYLTMITENLIGSESGRHIEGLACVLQAQTSRQWTSQFELEMFTIMSFSVLMESICNENMKLSPWLPTLLDRLEPLPLVQAINAATPAMQRFPSLDLRSIARITEIFKSPESRREELEECYREFMADTSRLRLTVDMMDKPEFELPPQLHYMRGRIPAMQTIRYSQLSLAAGMAFLANRTLQAFDPLDAKLIIEGDNLVQDIIDISVKSLPRRPLGAAHARPGLSVAWGGTRDPDKQAVLAALLAEIKTSSPFADAMKESNWWKIKFQEMDARIALSLGDHRSTSSGLEEAELARPQCHFQ